mgnify:CR=1 FL=1
MKLKLKLKQNELIKIINQSINLYLETITMSVYSVPNLERIPFSQLPPESSFRPCQVRDLFIEFILLINFFNDLLIYFIR